ncbi:hypothetical protein B0T16DRAFT_384460 [Cercophora newfieldiana]|uniref:Uncharacterized protein n=1 Tax=Cercophora newfieldiana TaxID=92897 RepID=A0AA39YN41_9PEZI|nr:hypothetical protein B0T16DRAFT_384460 [Cercophora newfieldiana]
MASLRAVVVGALCLAQAVSAIRPIWGLEDLRRLPEMGITMSFETDVTAMQNPRGFLADATGKGIVNYMESGVKPALQRVRRFGLSREGHVGTVEHLQPLNEIIELGRESQYIPTKRVGNKATGRGSG